MVKPDECIFLRARREIAEIRDLIDGKLVQEYAAGRTITIVIPASSDAIREQVAALYSVHWSLIHGFSALSGEHWLTFDCPPDDCRLIIDGDPLDLFQDPAFNGREVSFKIALRATEDGGFYMWDKIAPRIPARTTLEEFSDVYHPMLAARGIDRLLFVERSAIVKDDAGNWTVTIKGLSALRKSR